MIINQSSLQAVYKGFRTIFNEAFQNVKPLYTKVAMVVPSSVREETYAWLGAFPKMREWIGERHIKNLSLHSYSIRNKDWEATIEVDRNDIEDDSIGVYRPIVAELGRSAAQHPDELVFGLLAQGFSTICYDGQYFFDTDHPVGGSSVSNFGGGTGTAWYLLDVSREIKPLIFQSRREVEFISKDRPDDESVFMRKKYIYGVDRRDNAGFGLWQLAYASKDLLTADSYAAARAAMMSYKDDEGKPLGITPNLLVVPPSLEGAAREILLNERDASGATNKWRNTAELLVVPWLS
jgi:phage major head subunit gpT-like protein